MDVKVIVPVDEPFDEVLQRIHTAMGCAIVKKKPQFMWKLTTAKRGTKPFRFDCSEDWERLLVEYRVAHSASKKGNTVEAELVVDEQVCMKDTTNFAVLLM